MSITVISSGFLEEVCESSLSHNLFKTTSGSNKHVLPLGVSVLRGRESVNNVLHSEGYGKIVRCGDMVFHNYDEM